MTRKNLHSTKVTKGKSPIEMRELREKAEEEGKGWSSKSIHSHNKIFSNSRKINKNDISREDLNVEINKYLNRGGEIRKISLEVKPSKFDTDEETKEFSKSEEQQFLLDNVKTIHRIVGVEDFS